MRRPLERIAAWLGSSLTRKFILLLIGFLVLQGLQLGVGIYGILHLGQEAAFLNEAGRQRMHTLALVLEAEAAARGGRWEEHARQAYLARIAEQDRVLARFAEEVFYRHDAPPPGVFADARRHWEETLRPLLLAIAERPQAAPLERLRREAMRHVESLDALVTLAVRHMRTDALDLAVFQGAVLAITLLLGVIGLAMARYVVTLPARRLIASARAIAAGDYDQRLPARSRDELGELARTFNDMADAIARKTAGIEALNEFALRLSAATGLEELVPVILDGVMRLSDARGAALSLEEPPQFAPSMRRGLDDAQAAVMQRLAQTVLLEDRDAQETIGDEFYFCLPLRSRAGRKEGVLCLRLPARGAPGLVRDRALYATFAALAAEAVENARQYVEALDEALTDPLTGLANRRALDARLQEELERARRSGQPLSALMVDIDHFKRVNDLYGHAVGDEVLLRLAAVLREEIRGIDLAARYGGEEFVVLLPATPAAAAYAVAERIRRAVSRQTFASPEGQTFRVQVSIGIASFPDDDPEGDRLLLRADEALYAAKGAGRNRVMAFRELED